LKSVTAGGDPSRTKVLCAWYPQVRYHLALYSDMELCPFLRDLDRLLPAELQKAIEQGELRGKAAPSLVLEGARRLGAVGAKTRVILVLGLSSDARMKALGRWCGIKPWKTFAHPFGKGLEWWIYRISP